MAPPFAPLLASLVGFVAVLLGLVTTFLNGWKSLHDVSLKRFTMKPSATSPSSARKAATRARLAAAGAPASVRGRPRRKIIDPALYVLSVRLTPDEEDAMKKAAASVGMSVADWTRHAVTGKPIERFTDREVPSKIDAEYARAITAVANNANQLARAWGEALKIIGNGGGIVASDVAALKAAAEALVAALKPVTVAEQSAGKRLLSAARLALGVNEKIGT